MTVQGAGRTDAGVHALGQVAHLDLAKDWDADTVRDALTAHLRPHPVAVLAAEKVTDSFNARTSARARHYRYRIVNRRADLTLERGRAWRKVVKSPVKTLDQLDVAREGEEVRIVTSARSFLHTQVRSIVGSLVMVGEGRWSADDLARSPLAQGNVTA